MGEKTPENDRRFDQTMQLATFWIGRYYARADFEWKITLALWALLAAAASFLVDKKIPHLGLWSVLVIVGHASWLRGVFVSNFNDTTDAKHWAKQASALLINEEHKIVPRPKLLGGWRLWIGFLSNWSMLVQLGTTIVLVALITSIAGSHPPN